MSFNEHALELSIIELLRNKGYIHQTDSELIREKSEVLLVDDLKKYLRTRYAVDGLTESEIDSIILSLRTVGGTYFGTTGCGKSFTMLFLARMIMKSSYFKSPTILVIADRTDLDDQLSKQFAASKKFIGDDNVISIESREKLREELQDKPSGGVYLTTIQKFTEDTRLLTDRCNVICISDEAHRS